MRMFDRDRREEDEAVLEFVQPEPEDTAVKFPYFKVDHHADAVYIYISDVSPQNVARTDVITPTINADYDAAGRVVGIEFLKLRMDFGEEFSLRRYDQ